MIAESQSLMCIATKDYEIGALNWAEVRRYIEQSDVLLRKYEQERNDDNAGSRP